MLMLSNLVIAVTIGFSLLWQLFQVYTVARWTPAVSSRSRWLLVLGMRLRNGMITDDYVQRLDRASALQVESLRCRIVVLGGSKGIGGETEAHKGREYLIAHGIPPSQVLVEDKSSNTLENLRQARTILAGMDGEHTVLITSRYHLARSHAIATSLAIPHTLCAAEEKLRFSARVFLRLLQEAYYLHWFVVGSAWARLTANGALLKRIS